MLRLPNKMRGKKQSVLLRTCQPCLLFGARIASNGIQKKTMSMDDADILVFTLRVVGSAQMGGERMKTEQAENIEMLFGVEALPVRAKARWIDTEPDKPDAHYRKNGMAYFCSNCKHRAGKYKHRTYRYCPWCGAEMVGEDGEGREDATEAFS